MTKRVYQVMIVPERSAKVRRYRISYRTVMLLLTGLTLMAGVGLFLAVSYVHVVNEASKNRALLDENYRIKAALRVNKEEVERINAAMQRIHQFATKVRTITRLNDPERNLAIGPLASENPATTPSVMYAPGERIEYEDELADSTLAMRLVQSKVEATEAEARALESNIQELHEYFASDVAILSATPSIRPIASKLLNSTFGMRKDPYTGQQVMHKGIDFAADHGSDIFASADGTVVFAGSRGKHGKSVVIDHGYGLQTHYSHLSAFKVAAGDKVLRGQVIGNAGDTGLTTGVHLHYEVRYLGIPQDPEKYFLEEKR